MATGTAVVLQVMNSNTETKMNKMKNSKKFDETFSREDYYDDDFVDDDWDDDDEDDDFDEEAPYDYARRIYPPEEPRFDPYDDFYGDDDYDDYYDDLDGLDESDLY